MPLPPPSAIRPSIQHCRHRSEARAEPDATPAALFEYLDDPQRLGAHMGRRSWMLAGGTMAYELDARQGREVGAAIVMRGRLLGVPLVLTEVVDRYEPGRGKAWHTTKPTRLLVLDGYRMGFEITPRGERSELVVVLDWNPMPGCRGRLTAWLGRRYAEWCVSSVLRDAQLAFQRQT